MENKPKKILIIEDESSFARPAKIVFEQKGFLVIVAPDGESGLVAVDQEKPDIILLDLILPKMNGFAVLKQLKANEETKDIPVFVLSNLSQKKDIEECLSMGAVDFVVKTSVSMNEVIEKISKILG